jgi:hypothetical protein
MNCAKDLWYGGDTEQRDPTNDWTSVRVRTGRFDSQHVKERAAPDAFWSIGEESTL